MGSFKKEILQVLFYGGVYGYIAEDIVYLSLQVPCQAPWVNGSIKLLLDGKNDYIQKKCIIIIHNFIPDHGRQVLENFVFFDYFDNVIFQSQNY